MSLAVVLGTTGARSQECETTVLKLRSRDTGVRNFLGRVPTIRNAIRSPSNHAATVIGILLLQAEGNITNKAPVVPRKRQRDRQRMRKRECAEILNNSK